MKTLVIPVLLFDVACKSTTVDEPGSAKADVDADTDSQLDSELREELLAMLALDQKIREEAHQVVLVGSTGDHDHVGQEHPAHDASNAHDEGEAHSPHEHSDHPVHGDEMHTVDAANTKRLKEIVAEHGWPGRSLVGRDGALAAFLIAQHADADPAFQERCLELMQAASPGEVSPGDVAYLTDRVRVNSGQPQLYGTQFWMPNGALVPRPIEDPDLLDARREAAGLIPMSEYLEHMQQH